VLIPVRDYLIDDLEERIGRLDPASDLPHPLLAGDHREFSDRINRI
jgi:hypothetical protein